MSWEKVKGFCRRQRQKFEETYRHKEKTVDDEAEQGAERVKTYRRVAGNISWRFQRVSQNMKEIIDTFDGMRDDLKLMEQDSFSLQASRLEMVCLAMTKQHEAFASTVNATVESLQKYVTDCSGIEHLEEDCRSKKLEFDFFRNKVAALRAHPPSDPARIPRNEQRIAEWQKQYDESNDRLKNLAHNQTLNGIRAISEAVESTTAATSKLLLEASQTWRSTYGNGGSAASLLAGATAGLSAAASKVATANPGEFAQRAQMSLNQTMQTAPAQLASASAAAQTNIVKRFDAAPAAGLGPRENNGGAAVTAAAPTSPHFPVGASRESARPATVYVQHDDDPFAM